MKIRRYRDASPPRQFSRVISLCLLCSLVPFVAWATRAPARTQSAPKHKAKEAAKEERREIRAKAVDISSEEVKEWPGSSKRFALIIGVDQYQEVGNLKGAVKDAQLLADKLNEYADFPKAQIILLTSDSPDEKLRPTRTNILRRLEDLRAKIPKDGMLLLSFAGHGILGQDGHTYLLPSDAATGSPTLVKDTGISIESLKERILATGVKQVVLIVDSCRSPPGVRAGSGPRLSEAVPRQLNFSVRNKEVKAFATLFATSPEQSAYEDKKSEHGYFTLELVNALEGDAANLDGEVTLGRLVKHLEKAVPERVRRDLGQEQVPYVRYDGYKVDDLVIASSSPKLDLDELADRPIEGKLNGGKPKSYNLKPPAGHYLSLEIESRGLDVGVSLFAPDGKELPKIDDQDDAQGIKTILLIAEGAATYRLEVRSLTGGPSDGFYRIRRAALRPATAEDKSRISAQHAMTEARQLFSRYKWQDAAAKYTEASKHWGEARDGNGEGKALRSRGDIYDYLGEKNRALDDYQQALIRFRAVGARSEEALTLTLISRIYLSREAKSVGEATEARDKALESLNQVVDALKLDLVADANLKSVQKEIVRLGRERYELLATREIPTPDEEQKLLKLDTELAEANKVFRGLLDRQFKVIASRASQGLQADLRELGEGAVALYTIVGEDKYRVVLITPDKQIGHESNIKAADLAIKVVAFREALQNPEIDPRPAGKELYDILVGPVAKDLKAAQAKTLMWSLDGVLRYVPMSTLYDGQKYLVEQYRNVIYTPASSARLKDEPSRNWRVLGLGVSKAHSEFSALPGVAAELRGIVKEEGGVTGLLPGRLLLDEAFTRESFQNALRARYPVVHIASHFLFRPGDNSASSLLLGDGSRLSLREIEAGMNFSGVELLILSASDTATGGEGANGREMEGFAVMAQRRGAKSVMATLWNVADVSTALLMREFYRLRESQPGMTKAEALRQAQLALLTGAVKLPNARSDGRGIRTGTDSKAPFAHPYYWAPFILIGNWK